MKKLIMLIRMLVLVKDVNTGELFALLRMIGGRIPNLGLTVETEMKIGEDFNTTIIKAVTNEVQGIEEYIVQRGVQIHSEILDLGRVEPKPLEIYVNYGVVVPESYIFQVAMHPGEFGFKKFSKNKVGLIHDYDEGHSYFEPSADYMFGDEIVALRKALGI